MKKQFNLLLIFSAVLIFSSCSTIQQDVTEVPPSVQEFLQKNGTDFVNYEVSDTDSDNGYMYHEQSFNVYEEVETVWRDYMMINPLLAFNSRIINFGIVFNPEDSVVYTAENSLLPPFSEGQIYILNLKIMGIYNIPVAFKVSKIDSEKKMFEFIYLKNNVSNGFQQISLKTGHDSEGMPVTHIDHVSFFKSGHNFRDKVLYPPFHQQIVDNFHENIFKLKGLDWDSP